MLLRSMGRSNKHQSSGDFLAPLTQNTILIGWMADVGGRIVGENDKNDCACERIGLAVWLLKESGSRDGINKVGITNLICVTPSVAK